MAKLFLSYSRKDEAKARRFTSWLERQGHDVWRDQDDIGGGASFSSEIENALKDCEAVLVLWSADSIKSAWVRDEAGYGRDTEKLIPFSLDGIEPPLGFRQFQSIDLSKWKRQRDPPHAARIHDALRRIGRATQAPSAPEPAPTRSAETRSRRPLLLAGALILVAATLVGLIFWLGMPTNQQVTIAVLASPQSPNRAMAADYANAAAADMAAFLPRRFDRATVLGPVDAAAQGPAYRLEISTDPHGAGADATLSLLDVDGRSVLWSENWSVADAAAADLKAGVSESASKASLCLMDARGGRSRLTQPALGLYLSGCNGLGGTQLSNDEFVTIFERVTKLAPNFGPGWDYLALSRSWTAAGLRGSSPVAYAAAVQSTRNAIAQARKLNPNSAMSYDAEYHLIDYDTFRAMQVLQKGAEIDRDDGRIQMHLSNQLLSVGRMSDAIQAGERAVELEPASAYTMSGYIRALTYSGQFSKAKTEIADARKKWPNDSSIDEAEFDLQLHYGDPRAALVLLPRAGDASDAEMAPYRALIAARMSSNPVNINEAVAALDASSKNNPGAQEELLLALASFGRVDEVYQRLQSAVSQRGSGMKILFRPDFARVRADSRFMPLAARLGLVRYWRQTGYWPDFCTTERLPYDCKREAAKYRD